MWLLRFLVLADCVVEVHPPLLCCVVKATSKLQNERRAYNVETPLHLFFYCVSQLLAFSDVYISRSNATHAKYAVFPIYLLFFFVLLLHLFCEHTTSARKCFRSSVQYLAFPPRFSHVGRHGFTRTYTRDLVFLREEGPFLYPHF